MLGSRLLIAEGVADRLLGSGASLPSRMNRVGEVIEAAFMVRVPLRLFRRRLPTFERGLLFCLLLGWAGGEARAQSTPPAALALNGESGLSLSLDQADVGLRQPVSVTLLLSATSDGAAAAVAATITTTATAAAVVDVQNVAAADGLSRMLTLLITPNEDADAVVTLRATQGAAVAEAIIEVDAVDRVPASLVIGASDATLAQRAPGEAVAASINLRVLDNYGDDDRLPPTAVTLTAVVGDGQQATLPDSFEVPRGGGAALVSITPMGADTILTVTADLLGVESVSVEVRVLAAIAQLRLSDPNGDTDLSVTLAMAGDAARIQLRLQYFAREGVSADYPSAVTLAGEIVSGGDASVVLGATSFASLDAAGATITVVITPDEDSEAVIRISADAAADMLAADVMITVTPEARELANIVLAATTLTLTQPNFGDAVLAGFTLLAVDNYGRDDVLPAAVSLLAAASDGASAALLDDAADGEVTIGAGGARVEVEVTLAEGRDSVLSLTVAHDALGAFNAQVLISAAPIPVSMGFTGRSELYQTDMIVLGTLLEDIALFNRAYDANCNVIDEAARIEILAALQNQRISVRNVTLGEALDRAACAAVRQLDDGSGALLDVNGDDTVGFDDARLIDTMLSWRRTLGYAYDEDGMLIPERAFILDGVVRRVSRSSAPFPSDLDQVREIVQRVYLRLFHPSSPYYR